MDTVRVAREEWVDRIGAALLFVILGGLIIVVFSPLRPVLDETEDYLGRIALIVALFLAVQGARKNDRLEKYAPLLSGLLILTVAVSLDWIVSNYLLNTLGVSDQTPTGYALLKLNECAVTVCVVVLLTRLSGGSLGSIYFQKGNLKLGLTIGGIAFLLAAAASPWMAAFLFNGHDLTLPRIAAWLPWLLIFVLANGAYEEILFRGLFLQKLQPFVGSFSSNLLIAFAFTALHQGVNYTSDQYMFLAVLVPLALAWGYLMQRTHGVWASILFHAGMDIPIMLGIFSNL